MSRHFMNQCSPERARGTGCTRLGNRLDDYQVSNCTCSRVVLGSASMKASKGTSMARPLRIEFAGALYHATSRGNERREIFFAEEDRSAFLQVLEGVCKRFYWVCHAYCLMDNHYHLLVETPDTNLSKGMRQLNVGIIGDRPRFPRK